MYAVIETGGKQYRVEVGTELEVELLDVEPGQSITLDRVLLVADGAEAAVGTPVVDGAAVEAEVVGATRGDKVIAFKYRPKARRRVKKGHRQDLTVLRIADIRFGGKSAAEDEAKAKPSKADEKQAPRGGRRPAGRRGRRARREAQGRGPGRDRGRGDRGTEDDAAPRPRPRPGRRRPPPRPAERRDRRGRGRPAEAAEPRPPRPPRADDGTRDRDPAAAPKKRATRTKKDD